MYVYNHFLEYNNSNRKRSHSKYINPLREDSRKHRWESHCTYFLPNMEEGENEDDGEDEDGDWAE